MYTLIEIGQTFGRVGKRNLHFVWDMAKWGDIT